MIGEARWVIFVSPESKPIIRGKNKQRKLRENERKGAEIKSKQKTQKKGTFILRKANKVTRC